MSRSWGTRSRGVRILRHQRGVLTLDFIFALMMTMGLSLVFLAVAFTLSMVEVGQYVTFSSARASWAAHKNREKQIELGRRKYQELRMNPALRGILTKQWIRFGQIDFGDPLRGHNDDYPGSGQDSNAANDNETFIGARMRFQSTVLDFNLPLLGDSQDDDDTGVANIQTFLGREVTTDECNNNFNAQRWQNILSMQAQGAGQVYNGASGVAQPPPQLTDNGC